MFKKLIPKKPADPLARSEEHTSELQSQSNLVCRLLLEKKKIYLASHGRSSIATRPLDRQIVGDHDIALAYAALGSAAVGIRSLQDELDPAAEAADSLLR